MKKRSKLLQTIRSDTRIEIGIAWTDCHISQEEEKQELDLEVFGEEWEIKEDTAGLQSKAGREKLKIQKEMFSFIHVQYVKNQVNLKEA